MEDSKQIVQVTLKSEWKILSLQVECGGNNRTSKLAHEMYSFEEGEGKTVEVALGEVDTWLC